MHLIYLHQYFATPKCNGGTRSYEMAKRLVAKGHRVTLITSSAFLEQFDTFEAGWNEREIDGIELHIYHLPYSNNDSFAKRIQKFLSFSWASTRKAMKIGADLVFATSTPLTIAIPALIYKKFKKVPFVFEVRDLWPEVPIAMGVIKNKLLIKALNTFEKWTYKNASQVIALSDDMGKGVAKYGYDTTKIHVIPNSCDTELFSNVPAADTDSDAMLSFLNDRKLILYAGTFGLVNRVDYFAHLAHAAKNYPELCFVAIGSGMCKPDVIKLAKELDVYKKNFFILDPVSKDKVVHLYQRADLCFSLVGGIQETWKNSANKLFDAMAAGKPIAVNHGGWQAELINQEQCGVVTSDNYQESAKVIFEFLHNAETVRKAKQSSSDLAHKRYSRDLLFAKFEKALLLAEKDKSL
ncbi:glycosyltransferase family 4 protein [Pseudoalteromonas sp. YIC-656]|uniref:glycosyltransferase family 4 protein n=1 Tax=Pseudoalteromonas pernae TaxID=3118054 RepID=UPI0032420510